MNSHLPALKKIIKYIASVIKFFKSLCHGRNKKAIKKVLTLGITSKHILLVLNNKSISNILKEAYINLY